MNRFISTRLLSRCQKHVDLVVSSRYSVASGSKEHIDSLVKDKKVVVFMKGNADAPKCGFSNGVVQIMKFHGLQEFDNHDVLSDENLRQGIKDYTNWPTIPQVFIGGDFVGGFDIVLDMHKNGELVQELEKVGIRSALLDVPPENSDDKKSDT